MYNEQIENLINAALADGVLTEKEKQILFKKAESMGIDLDEFEMVLSSKLYEKQKAVEEERKKKSDAAPKSNKMGDVRKCPACGAIVSSYQVKCPECGYEFSEVAANSTAQLLAQKLNEVSENVGRMEFQDIKGFLGITVTASKQRQKEIAKESMRVVEAIPVPSSKADLLEFITSLAPRRYTDSADSDAELLAEAYDKKYQECINKAKINFGDDPMFIKLFKQLGEEDKEEESEQKSKGGCMGVLIGFIIVSSISSGLFSLTKAEDAHRECVATIERTLKDGNVDKAENLLYDYGSDPVDVAEDYSMVVSYYLDEKKVAKSY